MTIRTTLLTLALVAPFGLAACGGDDESLPVSAPATAPAVESVESVESVAGLAVVSPDAAAATIADPPAGLVILDVRTPDEFDGGHIEGATMLDFYDPGFAAGLAALDPNVPYVLYCRSGNRSGQTRAMMAELGFASVEDIDGGVVAWQGAGLPLTTD